MHQCGGMKHTHIATLRIFGKAELCDSNMLSAVFIVCSCAFALMAVLDIRLLFIRNGYYS